MNTPPIPTIYSASSCVHYSKSHHYEPSVFRITLGEKLTAFEGADMRGTAFVYMPDFQEEGYSGIATPLMKMNAADVPEGTITIPHGDADR